MTSTQESTRPIPLIGQAVGQAQASLTRILIGILAESGTSYQTYLGLQRLTALGGEATRDAYERDLSDWLELDGTAAARLADDLAAAGLAAAEGGAIRLTAQGRGLREGVLAASAKITGPMLATIDRGDLETTVRTLDEITRRARGIPARPAHYGGQPMTTQKLPGTDAARHGTGDADLTIMLRRTRRSAATWTGWSGRPPGRTWLTRRRPVGRRLGAVQARTAPAPHRRGRAHLAGAAAAAGAQRERPVRAGRDGGGARAHRPAAGRGGRRVRAARRSGRRLATREDRLADVIEVLASTLTGHLAHEERDGLPLIGVALTGAEWRGVGRKIGAQERHSSRGGDVRLDAGRRRSPACRRHLGPAPASAAPALPGRLEAPLRQDPALVSVAAIP